MNTRAREKLSRRSRSAKEIYHNDYVILVAEDDDDDFFLLQIAFADAEIDNPVVRVRDGEELLDYLHPKPNNRQEWQRPMVLILDINMPRVNGLEALKSIRHDEEWKRLPIIILSTAITDEAIEEGYKLGANSYIAKPNDLDTLVHICETFKKYWLSVVEMEKHG